jgi:hypothetical protein
VGVGVGFTVTFTPLFQTLLEPDLTQVYFFPCETAVIPTFAQEAPGLITAALTCPPNASEPRTSNVAAPNHFFMNPPGFSPKTLATFTMPKKYGCASFGLTKTLYEVAVTQKQIAERLHFI